MAHEITSTDGLVLFKEQAWHGLGTVVEEEMSPMEAMKIAGLDWKVAFPDTQVSIFGDKNVPLTKSRTLYRLPKTDSDSYIELGSHGLDYEPLQNEDLFSLAYSLNKDVKVESAGSLFGGRKVWVLLRGDTFSVGKNDEVVKYMSLMNGHDGTLTLSALPTSVRIVCNNTLNMALTFGAKKMLAIRHTTKIKDQVKIMENALKHYSKTGEMFMQTTKVLEDKKIKNHSELIKLWTEIYANMYGAPDSENEKEKAQSVETLQAWSDTFEVERGLLNCDASYWLAVNAATSVLQKAEPMKKQNGWEERALQSKFYGQKSDLTTGAFKTALSLI